VNSNEKTPDRIPFPIFFTGRVELRKLPSKRLGADKEMCVGLSERNSRQESSMGA
jgi:hypothetical protein